MVTGIAEHGLIKTGIEDFLDLQLNYLLLVLFFGNLVRVPPFGAELLPEIVADEINQHFFILVGFLNNFSEMKLSFHFTINLGT
jgi:hypothetical protein